MKTFEKVVNGSNEYGIPKCKFTHVLSLFNKLMEDF
jgi:hypothetical protein